ncbi:MAG: hypothetical protein EPN48_05005 [Microbacteriaceae bacterium]|nr:MAG: hypothetical protein EPN48_05005 [Microbacteriaceae bacterium]
MYSDAVDGWIIAGVILLAVVLVMLGGSALGWIDLSDKSRRGGRGSGVLSIGDEVFAPTRYEAQVELDRQTVLPAPAPIAGDGDKGIFHDGPVRIRLDTDGKSVR